MKSKSKFLVLAATAAILAAAGAANAQQARDQIRVVGSSTVFPFTSAVAEQFARGGQFRAPIVESIGTGAGIRAFCQGVGVTQPDIANASRRMTASEFATCKQNGVTEITELKIGFDGIVMAVRRGSPAINLTREHFWKGLAREVPVNGQWVRNPYASWNQVDPSLPSIAIEAMGPPPTSGTRDSFNELVLLEGCKNVPEIKAITDAAERNRRCQQVREDGKFVEAGENDNLIVQRLTTGAPGAFGIFGYSFLDQNRDRIEGKTVDGVAPTFENIADGKYPVSRSMYIYVKKAHVGVIPGLREFVTEYASERAVGQRGYLASRGLITLPPADRDAQRSTVQSLTNLNLM
ncbi:MAG: substrate-binding domain-containing protein [Alphaproteobacteria bacterium]|nr:substrate-binding domain-containing protein [Alphaproteobacteria bacterium]